MIIFSRIFYSIILYVFIIWILIYTKPSLLFNTEGHPKRLGSSIDAETSIFAPAFLFPIIAFLCYYIVSYTHVFMI